MTAPDLSSSRPRPAAVFLLKLVVSVGLLYWLLAQADLRELGRLVRHASLTWLGWALALYLLMVLASAWRWGVLLAALDVRIPWTRLVDSFLVATFFNNFLPSNIGGDLVRVRDTAAPAGSLTRATTVVIVDRLLGLLALLLIAAAGASLAGAGGGARVPVWPSALWLWFLGATAVFVAAVVAPQRFARLLAPLTMLNRTWVEARIERLTGVVTSFRAAPGAMLTCFAGAVVVQGIIVLFYLAIAYSLSIEISPLHLAVIVPVSLASQLLPISVNGFGVREATFTFYFKALHLPVASAVALSLIGAGLILIFSLSGGLLYLRRQVAGPGPRG